MRPSRWRYWRKIAGLLLMWGALVFAACFFLLASAMALLYAISPAIEPGSK